MSRKVSSVNLGRISYSDCLSIQRTLQDKIIKGDHDSCGHILFLEHDPVITVGKFGREQNLVASREILSERGIELFETERGGDFTYHGPGQLVCYPILNLKKLGIGVKKYVNKLEEVIINTLSELGMNGERKDNYPGVWAGDSKIAFIGIYVKKHVTMHGFSLNINRQSDNFSHIIPCGISDLQITSVSEILKKQAEWQDIIDVVIEKFEDVFDIELDENKEFT
ncbi:MAG: lipoyl(octanoyl) transferase LipB [Nitrosopumilaceae archaeon]|nr:lipoyl(octanoyl) transferase LipB [Nitrosopumilaceae archaeon]